MSDAEMLDKTETINITSDMSDPSDDDLDMDVEIIEESNEELANARKEQGNTLYKIKKYREALQCYTEAINLCPTCAAYYGNRAAAYMMLNYYVKALEDARTAVQLDSNFVKGHLREGKCHLTLGNIAAAFNSYNKVLALEPSNSQALNELQLAKNVQEHEIGAEKDLQENGDHRRALFRINQCLAICPYCVKFRIKKAEALCLLERYDESQSEAADILQRDGVQADALFIRGTCLYYQDNIEKAFLHFQQVLKFAPDHSKAHDIYKKAKLLLSKKESGNKAFRSGQLHEAYQLYTDALEVDKRNKFTNSKLYFNRATVCSKISKLEQSIEDCTKAIDLDNTYLKAYLRRAKSYQENEKYEEAVYDYEKICKMDKSREHKKLLQDAKIALKRSKRKDYYKILGITKQACDDEIKKAYKKRALIHHPDRHAHAEEINRKEEEKKFKELGEAYAVLSDSKKRMRYDQGHDLEDLDGCGSFFQEFDPNQIFQTFFTNGGHGAGGGGGGFHFSTNMPGDYTFQFG